jgi:hypothetical protein
LGRRIGRSVRHRSVEHSLRAWVRANGCREEPATEALPDKASDGTTLTVRTYASGPLHFLTLTCVQIGLGTNWSARSDGKQFARGRFGV